MMIFLKTKNRLYFFNLLNAFCCRFIIGQKGVGVREMMNNFDVNIRVPSVDAKSDLILISGVPTNVEAAKVGLGEKVAELEVEKEDKIKRSFMVSVSVAPEYHPKIIGRKGAVITKLRWELYSCIGWNLILLYWQG